MLYFQHAVFGTVFVSREVHPVWRQTFPDGTPTRVRNTHLYCRQAPDQGHPERECGIVPIAYEQFTGFLEAIPFQQAYQLDPHLLDFVGRLATYPTLPTVLEQLPPESSLHLVACACSREEEFFAVYRVTEEQNLVFLNHLLEPFLPWQVIEGVRLFAVPCSTHLRLASEMLVLALERCLWGVNASSSLKYSFGYEIDENDALEA